MVEFEQTLERIQNEIDEGDFTRGVQAVVEVGGERLLEVAHGDSGTGTAMTSAHVLRVYCTGKPVLAVAIAQLIDDGVLDLDEPLAERLPRFQPLVGGTSLRNVLTHTAGLHAPMGITMETLPPGKRRATIEQTRRPSRFRVGVDAAYSEYAGWHILGWLIEDTLGVPLRGYLRDHVLEPLQLRNTWIGMTPEEYQSVLPRLGINHEMRHPASMPMLYERTERVCLETNPAHGCYTNAGDLAHFYTALLARLDDGVGDALPSPSTLRAFTSIARTATHDEVLDRECSYGLGFMTSLSEHAFGEQCSPSSFGHSGNVGASFAFADPDESLAVAVVFNGLVGHEAAFLRRRSIVGAIYSDLANAGQSDSSAAFETQPRRGNSIFKRLRSHRM
jgi:CubicO group peptidase (beta-lactamase class C family)